jgi:DNA-binding response OmpR family regulator
MTQQILIISDDETNESLRQALVEHGLKITVAKDADAGYWSLVETKFDLVLVNLADPLTGVSLIQRIRSNAILRKVPILTVAEWGTGQATLALSQGSDGFEPKPIDADRLVEAIEKLLRPRMAMSAKASTANGESDD